MLVVRYFTVCLLLLSQPHGACCFKFRIRTFIIIFYCFRFQGIWHNKNKNFLIWINEEDHARVISMEKGGDMRKVFDRFCRGLKEVERHVEENGHGFMWSRRLGYILTCPSNLGTGLRAGKLTCYILFFTEIFKIHENVFSFSFLTSSQVSM